VGYRLGVDLGTTFTAAAVGNGRAPTMLGLGNRALQIPSVLFLRDDGAFLVGEAAERKGLVDPARVVREFKRRMGDPVPLLVGGTPFSPQALTARLLTWVVATATERMGSAPDEVVLTYPANWGAYKRELLDQVIAMADVGAARTCQEPQAAAVQYAARSPLDPGERVAVYDLGGGTFDVCVLEKTADGFTILGTPDGVEHLGGVDFDEAVFQHVVDALGSVISELDLSTAEAQAALTRLRRDCVEAKEALSSDVDAVIPVAVPGRNTQVRMTRAELEGLIGPSLQDTIAATSRALRAANTTSGQLSAIVLVGGSSRIPLVSHLLQSTFATTTSLDTHPKHDIALGAVQYAATGGPGGAATPPPPAGSASQRVATPPAAPSSPPAAAPSTDREARPAAPPAGSAAQPDAPPAEPEPEPAPRPPRRVPPVPPFEPGRTEEGRPWWRNGRVAIGAAAAAVLAVVVVAVVATRDRPQSDPAASGGPTSASSSSGPAITGTPGLYGLAVSPDGSRIYVSNRDLDTLSVIDLGTGQLAGPPIVVGSGPLGVAVSPGGARAYVANGEESSIWEINTATLATVGNAITVGSKPLSIATHPTSSMAYVTNRSSDSVSVVDTVANKTVRTIRVGDGPEHVLLAPDEDRAYVTNLRDCTITVINTARNRVSGDPVQVHAYPAALALSPDGSRLYVTTAVPSGERPGCGASVDPREVIVVDPEKREAVGPPITLPAEPFDVAIGAGGRLYATLKEDDEVVVMDTSTGRQASTPIPVGDGPTEIAASPDGGRLYVANSVSGTISVIDTATGHVVDTIRVGN
jgi:YVTN family beta-propeller protein